MPDVEQEAQEHGRREVTADIMIRDAQYDTALRLITGKLVCHETRMQRWWAKYKIWLFALVSTLGIGGLLAIGVKAQAVLQAPAKADSATTAAVEAVKALSETTHSIRSDMRVSEVRHEEQWRAVRDGIGELKAGQQELTRLLIRGSSRSRDTTR